ncbi:methylated-DNA--protein-cysteine methyltransferase [Arthrobacter crystallopoietes BAB-32]|uniref:Methylated-DNA--protein-cysteine methyltransferase n=1 Tax=Arthrobacter crystallopoietes BAB-32 TaxID=1246476 RepID=N1V085_9MICC|nr:methylated-DNA--[protein]-cysteine S-methyltransferase [Arthrobacter crystallopoietes]EMY34710.1 methylated-DNA--protein-cysteine methyltransferase [Arthrobacter crystallopoietes BAB-32]
MSRTHSTMATPIGELTLVAEEGALTAIYFPSHKRLPDAAAFGERTDEGFGEAKRQLCEYFAGERREFSLPLAPKGDAFQLKVWELLRAIPYGQTRSYGQLAAALGDPHLAQAVGNANGRNPLSIVVPCHRVVGADGSLTGYAGGLERKRFLLELEEPAETKAGRLF